MKKALIFLIVFFVLGGLFFSHSENKWSDKIDDYYEYQNSSKEITIIKPDGTKQYGKKVSLDHDFLYSVSDYENKQVTAMVLKFACFGMAVISALILIYSFYGKNETTT